MQQRAVTVLALLAVLPAAASAVDVGGGVQFNLSEQNVTLESGKTYSFSTVTVHDDAVTFDGNNVSVRHSGSRQINATLWNYTVQEIVSEPSIRIGTNTSDGTRVTFNVTGVVQERTYRIDKDGSRLVTPETGQAAVLTWNESDWTGPANFTATLLETIKNATLIFTGSFNHPQDTVTIDGTASPSTGTFLPGDVNFGYAAFALAGDIAGVVPGGTFERLEFTNTSSQYEFAQTQAIGDSIFLLPLTEGSSSVIEDREGAIQGNLFGGGNFLSFPNPSFAYEVSQEKTVRVALSYDAISLHGFDDVVSPGTYTVTITNEGTEDGTTQVNLTVQ